MLVSFDRMEADQWLVSFFWEPTVCSRARWGWLTGSLPFMDFLFWVGDPWKPSHGWQHRVLLWSLTHSAAGITRLISPGCYLLRASPKSFFSSRWQRFLGCISTNARSTRSVGFGKGMSASCSLLSKQPASHERLVPGSFAPCEAA